MTDRFTNEQIDFSTRVDACRHWLQGRLYPNTDQDSFLSLLMGMYGVSATEALKSLHCAEYAEQLADAPFNSNFFSN